MNVMPVSNPYAPELPQNSATRMQDIARRHWQAQQRRERQLKREQGISNDVDHVNRIRRLRPGRSAANPLSPVYNMFDEAFLRTR